MKTHKCGACGAQLFTARFRDSGVMVHVEKADHRAGGVPLELVPELPGVAGTALPHVAPTRARLTPFREHLCPKVRAFSAGAGRKVRA